MHQIWIDSCENCFNYLCFSILHTPPLFNELNISVLFYYRKNSFTINA